MEETIKTVLNKLWQIQSEVMTVLGFTLFLYMMATLSSVLTVTQVVKRLLRIYVAQ